MINTLESLISNIMFSHIVVKENQNNKTLIRLHLIPLNKKILRTKNKHVAHLPKYTKIKEDLEEMCAICLSNFKKNEYLRKLPICNHDYHKKCIDKWFQKDKNMKCPVCRTEHHKGKILHF